MGGHGMTTVLVVDDEPAILRALSISLTARDYTVLTAARVTGSFSSITGQVPTPGLTQSVTIDPTDVQLALTNAPAALTVARLGGPGSMDSDRRLCPRWYQHGARLCRGRHRQGSTRRQRAHPGGSGEPTDAAQRRDRDAEGRGAVPASARERVQRDRGERA